MLADITQFNTWFDYRRVRFWVLVVCVLYALAGFFGLPWALQKFGPDLAKDFTQRELTIGDVSFNPWTLRLEVKEIALLDPDGGELATVGSAIVNVTTTDVFQLALGFDEITLNQPRINLKRYAFADTNWGRMLNDIEAAEAANPPAEPEPEPDPDAGPLRVDITRLSIFAGSVVLADDIPETPFNVAIEPINITVNNLSTLEDVSGREVLTLALEDGMEVTWEGTLELNPLVSEGVIRISGSPFDTVYRYFEPQLNFNLDNCCLEVALNYTAESLENGDLALDVSDAEVTLSELAITAPNDDPVFNLPELRVRGGRMSLLEQTVHIDRIVLDGPELFAWLNPDGSINLEKAFVDGEPPPSPVGPAEAAPADEPAEEDAEAQVAEDAESADSEWAVTLDSFRIDNMRLNVEDRSLATPGVIELMPMNLRVNDISLEPGSFWGVNYDATLTSGGAINFEGGLVALPEVSAEGVLTVTGLELPVLQPWVQQQALVALDRGALNISLAIESNPTETLAANGDVNITNLSVSDTTKDQALVGWEKLALSELAFVLDGNELNINRVKVTEPFGRVRIAQDGTTNFDSLAKDPPPPPEGTPPEPAETEEAAEPTEPLAVVVGGTEITDGKMDFADRSLPLPFRALITEFTGTMSTIDSRSTQPSTLNFAGRVGEFGSATISGDVSVLDPTRQTAVLLDFKNLDMTTLSPYTAEFVGRTIEDGKLNLALDYSFDDNRINGQNNMVLTDLKLGEEIDSEEAVSLPLDLAIAVLRDSNGVIDLDLAVEGDADDPSFSAGGMIMGAFTNLITKIATAPFKLLGGLVPGGSDLDLEAIEFMPGSAEVMPPEQEKLVTVNTALAERPALRLELQGGYVAEEDTAALQKASVEARLDELLDDEPTPKETRKALEKLAKQQLADVSLRDLRKEFDLPDPETGNVQFDELAYAEELRTQLQAAQPIGDAELQALAEQRRDALVAFMETQTGAAGSQTFAAGEIVDAEVSDRDEIRVPLGVEPVEE